MDATRGNQNISSIDNPNDGSLWDTETLPLVEKLSGVGVGVGGNVCVCGWVGGAMDLI